MTTLVGVYSVDLYQRTPQQIVDALFRDKPTEQGVEPTQRRPLPQHKRITPYFAGKYQDDDASYRISRPMEECCWLEREIDQRRKSKQPLVVLGDGAHCL